MKNFVLILWIANLQALGMETEVIVPVGTDLIIPMSTGPSIPSSVNAIGMALAPFHHGPFSPTAELDQQHWDRLLYLSMVRNNVESNPFTPEQQELFRTECAKKNRQAV